MGEEKSRNTVEEDIQLLGECDTETFIELVDFYKDKYKEFLERRGDLEKLSEAFWNASERLTEEFNDSDLMINFHRQIRFLQARLFDVAKKCE